MRAQRRLLVAPETGRYKRRHLSQVNYQRRGLIWSLRALVSVNGGASVKQANILKGAEAIDSQPFLAELVNAGAERSGPSARGGVHEEVHKVEDERDYMFHHCVFKLDETMFEIFQRAGIRYAGQFYFSVFCWLLVFTKCCVSTGNSTAQPKRENMIQ